METNEGSFRATLPWNLPIDLGGVPAPKTPDQSCAVWMSTIGEVLPNAESFIDLHPSRVDANGVPLPQINSQLGKPEIARLKFMAMQPRRLLKAAGVDELVEETGTWDRFSTTHAFGSCKMSNDSNASFVDANCQTHDIPNLFITDASVFPSTGGGEAPSLTIQALAVRAAEFITK